MIQWIPTLCAALGATLLLGPALPPGGGGDKEPDRSADQAAVRARTQEFLKALAKGDAREAAAFWTPTGEYARGELTIRGRANIQKAYAEHLKKKRPGLVTVEGESVRFLADDAAVLEGMFVVKRPNPAQSTRSQVSILFVRSSGKWHFGMLRESSEEASLQELAWLVGTWTFPSGGAETRMVVEWAEGKKYLLCRTTSQQDGRTTTTATQILAVHPATGAIQSWTFERDGSLGESVWSRTDKGWTAKVTSVTADGEKATATTTLTPVDENTFTFRSTDRTVNGEPAPDVGPITVTRRAGGKGQRPVLKDIRENKS
jgi:uncharacterized protein (TIGR02246 family)